MKRFRFDDPELESILRTELGLSGPIAKMRRFEMHRDNDVYGVSGTGLVAEGVVFSDGEVAIRWLTEHRSTVVWRSFEDAEIVHGHNGATRFVWIDEM